MADEKAYGRAIDRVTDYQGGDPIFIPIEGWTTGITNIFKAFCKARGLTVKEGMARGKKTIRISKDF